MITLRYNVLHKLNYNIYIWLAPIIISIMSLVQTSERACLHPSLFACEQVNLLLTKVLIRQFPSDVQKIILNDSPVMSVQTVTTESPGDSQFNGTVISKSVWIRLILNVGPRQTSLFKSDNVFQPLMYQTDSTRSLPHVWLSLRDLFLSITLYCLIIST